MIIIVVYQHL